MEKKWPKTDDKLAELLGCSESHVRGLRSKHRSDLIIGLHFDIDNHPSNSQKRYLWKKEGAIFLAQKTTKDKSKRFLDKLGVAKREKSRIESQVITIIKDSFHNFLTKFRVEYPVGPFRIDLYLPEINLAIECDEQNHSHIHPWDEEYRENFIKEKIKCDFLRFNPDDPNFNIGQIINKILKRINSF